LGRQVRRHLFAVRRIGLERIVPERRNLGVENGRDLIGLFVIEQLSQHVREHENRLGHLTFAVPQRLLFHTHRSKKRSKDVRHRIDQKDSFHSGLPIER
jgi:hypothetical protein